MFSPTVNRIACRWMTCGTDVNSTPAMSSQVEISVPPPADASFQTPRISFFCSSTLRSRPAADSGVPYMKFSRRVAVASHFGSRWFSSFSMASTVTSMPSGLDGSV